MGLKWVDKKFQENLEELKRAQNEILEDHKYKLTAQLSRASKIHEREELRDTESQDRGVMYRKKLPWHRFHHPERQIKRISRSRLVQPDIPYGRAAYLVR